MANAHLLRTTLEALDDFIESVRSGSPRASGITRASERQPRFVIDEGRAAAEWTLDIQLDGGVERIGLLVVCDVDDDRVTDARLYVAPSRHTNERKD